VQRSPNVGRLTPWLAAIAGSTVAVLSTGSLILWATGHGYHYGPLGQLGTPPPEAAVSLLLAGVALLFAIGHPGILRRGVVATLGCGLGLIGLLGIADHTDLLTTSPVADAIRDTLGTTITVAPPMSAASSCAVLLIGLALVAPLLPNTSRQSWPQSFAPAAAAIAGVTLLAYLFGRTSVPALGTLVTMTPLTSINVLLFTVGIVAARPDQGMLRPFGSVGPGGTLSRRVGPTLMLLPFGIALVSGLIIQAGWGEPTLTVSLATAAFVLVFIVVLGGTAKVLDLADAQQRALLDALAAERDFSGTLLRSLSEAVFVYDRDLRVIDVNPSGCRLVDRPREELIGARPPYPWQTDEHRVATTGAGEPRHLQRPDGSRVPVLAMMSPVLDDQSRPRAFVGTFVDITAHRQAEEALASHAAELEQANQQLQLRHEELVEAAHFKGDLMSIVSHEVSQPLSSVASLSELLNAEWAELPDDMRQELANKIDRNARRLTSMINDMLLLFRLDAGVVSARRTAVPIADVVDTLVTTIHTDTPMDTSGDPQLSALVDRGHLFQILTNLVNNAVAYGAPPIEITTENRADGVIVAVRDHGPGVPLEDRPRLFERIARSAAAAGGHRGKGTGLGLFIVRHLVELNHGSIWYEDAHPTGARLMLRLEHATPVNEPATADARDRKPDAAPTTDVPGDVGHATQPAAR